MREIKFPCAFEPNVQEYRLCIKRVSHPLTKSEVRLRNRTAEKKEDDKTLVCDKLDKA